MWFKQYLVVALIIFLAGCSSSEVVKTSSPEMKKSPVIWNGDIQNISHWPDQVMETSGLAQRGDLLWTINDSGDGPYIYSLKNNKVQSKVEISNAKNIDWEDLAQDDEYLYIADCGNNRGQRRTVQIYKVNWKSIEQSGVVAADMIINLTYADQPIRVHKHDHNYDCEALVSVGDELWLFSKNRKDLKTWLYKIDKNLPNQSISLDRDFEVDGLITAADYDPESNRLVLLGYSKQRIFGRSFLWVVPVDEEPLWKGAKYLTLYPYAQWEALVWDSQSTGGRLILSSEKNPLLDVSVGEMFLPQNR